VCVCDERKVRAESNRLSDVVDGGAAGVVSAPVLAATLGAGGAADLLVILPHLVAGAHAVPGAADEDLAATALGTIGLAGA